MVVWWEGGRRVRAFVSGSMVPSARRGTEWAGLAHSSDWYLTLIEGDGGPRLPIHTVPGYSSARVAVALEAEEVPAEVMAAVVDAATCQVIDEHGFADGDHAHHTEKHCCHANHSFKAHTLGRLQHPKSHQ